jgi:phage tail sheath protein FI
MPEYLSPGVYVEEIDLGPKPIEGVSTSTAGFVGFTERGPVTGLPVLVTSFPEYVRNFGGFFDFGPTFNNEFPHAISGFFTNGGKRAYIRRVPGIGVSLAAASHTLQGGLITRLLVDALSGANKARLTTLRRIEASTVLTFTQVKNGLTTTSGAHPVTAIDRTTNEVTFGGPVLPSTFEAQFTTVSTPLARPNSFVLHAANPGTWGNGIDVRVFHTTATRSTVVGIVAAPSNRVQLTSSAGFYVGAVVEFDRGDNKVYRKVTAINGVVIDVDGAALAPGALNPQPPATATIASVCEFALTVSFENVTEDFRGLTLENVPGKFYADVINNSSILVHADFPPAGTVIDNFPSGDDGLHVILSGGNNGNPPGDPDFVGVDNGPGLRSGIKALLDIDSISIISTPGRATQTVQQALIEQCELLKYRVCILDPQPLAGNAPPKLNDIQSQRNQFDTKYAAFYYPRIIVEDPLTELSKPLSPSGHMAGIWARVDEERGVFKPPANEVIRGITDLELILTEGEQDILNPEPENINVLRDFRLQGRGLRVWGARVITSDTLWKYLNVRRLFAFLEASLDRGTQYAVFEPNDEKLWARITQSITNFLTRVWRDGALMGTEPAQAFFVKCDATTMTQDDIDNGRLIIIIGVAPVKPAEFVIIRIGQKAGLATVEEI